MLNLILLVDEKRQDRAGSLVVVEVRARRKTAELSLYNC